jgi:hypothetical protein
MAMFLAPVIERELRGALHTNRGTKTRFRVALIGASIVVLFLLISYVGGSGQWGRALQQWFFYAGLYLAIVPAARISIGLFSEERRNQTLELLYLTGMDSGQLFLGKLAGGTLLASADLLAGVPLLAVPFLIGGISLHLYIATIVCLPALLLFAIAVGVLASVLFTDDGAAFVFMVVFIGCVSLAAPVPYYLGKTLTGAAPFSPAWLCLSPAYAPYLVATDFGTFGVSAFWMAVLGICVWSGLCLGFACFYLSRTWRSEIQGISRTGWRGRFDAWVHGSPSWRAALREKLMTHNPYQWLVQQDRRPVLVGYCAVGLIAALWLLGWLAWPRYWPSSANFFITAVVLIWLVDWLTLFTAARRIGTDRRDGSLELLLTTGLTPLEVADGHAKALANQFRPLRRTVLGLFMVMILGGIVSRSWNTRAVISFAMIWSLLFWFCIRHPKARVLKTMWLALNTGRPVHAVFKLRQSNWTWIWILYMSKNLFHGLARGTTAFPTGSVMESFFMCLIFGIMLASYFVAKEMSDADENHVRMRIMSDMRAIAADPLPDPNDPLYKKWDGIDRLKPRNLPIEFRNADLLQVPR